MGERRWIPSNSWGVHAAGAWPHTDAEVLAEMGGERTRLCYQHGHVWIGNDTPQTDLCKWAWVWVVREADDE